MATNVDSDSEETQDWIDSVDAVVGIHGAHRAGQLLAPAFERARRAGVPVGAPVRSDYVNTIEPDAEAPFPGDGHGFWISGKKRVILGGVRATHIDAVHHGVYLVLAKEQVEEGVSDYGQMREQVPRKHDKVGRRLPHGCAALATPLGLRHPRRRLVARTGGDVADLEDADSTA